MSHNSIRDALTCKLRERLELLLPAGVDLDPLLDGILVLAVESLLLAVEDQLLRVLGLLGGEDGEEVLPGAGSALRVHVGEVVLHALQLHAIGVEVRHGDLVVPRRVADLDVGGLEQMLLFLEDLLEELGRDHVLRRHVVLAVG